MRRVIYFFVAFIIWVIGAWPFVDGKIDGQVVIAGLIASAIVAVLFHEILPKEHRVFISPVRVFWALVYIPVFFYYIIKANLDVVYRALHPKMPIRPGIVKIKTSLKTDSGITALANSITLTPGTLTVDLTDDGYLYIHWINVKSDDIEQATKFIAQRFEWFLAKIFEE
ncbi:MAG: Na+/H+ antiporter subunit E [Planctomycetota bacterium]|jgi:multicomponent Na+:H+ antiporter subunit E